MATERQNGQLSSLLTPCIDIVRHHAPPGAPG
jgi:hypothetical protein